MERTAAFTSAEQKATFRTSEVEGHAHERFFPEGPIRAGNYRTDETLGHRHWFTVEDLQPGESRHVTTSPPIGSPSGHRHELVVLAVGSERRTRDGAVVETKPAAMPSRLETKIP